MAFVTSDITDKFTINQADVTSARLSVAIWLNDDYTKKEIINPVSLLIKEGNLRPAKNPGGYYFFINMALKSYNFIVESIYYIREEQTIEGSKIKIKDVPLKFVINGPNAGAVSVKLEDVSRLQNNDIIEFRKSDGTKERKIITNVILSTGEIFWTGGLQYDFSAMGSTIMAMKNPVVQINLKPSPSYPFPGNATLIRGQVLWGPGAKQGFPVDGANVNIVGKSMGTKTDINGEFVFYFRGLKSADITNFSDLTIQIIKDSIPKIVPRTEDGNAITIKDGKTLFIGTVTFQ